MKYQVKVGQDFDPKQKLQVKVEVTISSDEKEKKPGLWADWRKVAVAAVFVLVAAFGFYGAQTGNMEPFDKILDTIVGLFEQLKDKSDGKEGDKSHDARSAGAGGEVVRKA